MFPISAEPTLHRIKWADVDGDRKLELIVAPLHGKGAKGAEGPAARAAGLQAAGESEDRSVADGSRRRGEPHPAQFPVDELDKDPQEELVTAGHEGLMSVEAREGRRVDRAR